MASEKNSSQKVEMASVLFDQLGVRSEAEEIKSKYQKEAFEHLDAINLTDSSKDMIRKFAEDLLGREF